MKLRTVLYVTQQHRRNHDLEIFINILFRAELKFADGSSECIFFSFN